MKDEAVFPFWRALLLNGGEADDIIMIVNHNTDNYIRRIMTDDDQSERFK